MGTRYGQPVKSPMHSVMRALHFVTLLGGISILLAACAPGTVPTATPAPKPPSAAATPKAEAPKYGGILKYTATARSETLMPHKAAGTAGRAVLGPVYESLLSYDYRIENGKVIDYRADWPVVPWLAERWEQPDDTTYIFYLRRGIRWQDGVEFTAEDVVFTYNLVRDPKNAFQTRGNLAAVDAVSALDTYTVKVTTRQPNPIFLTMLADPVMMILPKHVSDKGESFDDVAVGTGPFKLKSFDRASSSTYTRNESYWQSGKPFLNGIEVFFNLDRSARNAAFITKKVDLRAAEDKVQFETIMKAVPDAKSGTAMNENQETLFLKVDRRPFDDVRLRRAIDLAVDRQELVKLAAFEVGVINPPAMHGGQGWAIPQEELLKLPGYRQPKDADLAEARRLLTEAGYAAGIAFSVVFNSERTSTGKIAEVLAGQLKRAGITMTLKGMPTAEWAKVAQEGSYEAVMDYAGNMRPMQRQFDYLHSKGPLHSMGFNDPQLDRFIDIQRESQDANQRKEAALGMQRLLLEQVYIIPTIAVGVFQLWHPWVRDYVYNMGSSEVIDLQNVAGVWLNTEQMPSERR